MSKRTFVIVSIMIVLLNVLIAYMIYNKKQRTVKAETPQPSIVIETKKELPSFTEKPEISLPVKKPEVSLPVKKPIVMTKTVKKKVHKKRIVCKPTRKTKYKKTPSYPRWAKEAFKRAQDA